MKKIICFTGIGIGILCIIFSIAVFESYGSEPIGRQTYGGDAYTGIQNAAAVTANNVDGLYDLIALIGGFILLISGLIIILSYFKHLIEIVETETMPMTKYNNTMNTDYGTRHCNTCGHIIIGNPDICSNCGNKIGAPVYTTPSQIYPPISSSWKCSECGKINANYIGTCKCGSIKPKH